MLVKFKVAFLLVVPLVFGACSPQTHMLSKTESCFELSSLKIYNEGKVYFVSPKGNDRNTGLLVKSPLKHIQKALEKAQPGDTIVLLPGIYRENIRSVRDGLPQKPIVLLGTPGSLLVGGKNPGRKIIHLRHSHIQLYHLTVSGQWKNCERPECFHDKLLYVEGSPQKYLKGIGVYFSRFEKALGECLRFKYVTYSEILGNTISYCGLRDFYFHLRQGKKNGEGIYIGTAPEQAHRGPDFSHHLRVAFNAIATHGAECIDVKEGSYHIFLEHNLCTDSFYKEGGGLSLRGNNNVIRDNIIFGNKGAGIRLGGDTPSDGIRNFVTENYLEGNEKAALKIMRLPQAYICGNRAASGRKLFPENLLLSEEAFKECGNYSSP